VIGPDGSVYYGDPTIILVKLTAAGVHDGRAVAGNTTNGEGGGIASGGPRSPEDWSG